MVEDYVLILTRLLLLMFSLAVIGEPLRTILNRFSRLFKHLDFLQILVLDFYLGGFIFYVIAMAPFSFLNPITIWLVLAFSIFFVIVKLVCRRRTTSKIHDFLGNRAVVATTILFISTLLIQIIPLTNFVFGSIHDSSLHALFTQVILENGHVPLTLQPYSSEGIIYHQATHVIFAYACHIMGYSSAEAVFHVTVLFQALTILGAYYLGKALFSKELGLSFAFVFFCVSRWPRLVTWGANAYIAAFPLQFILISLIPLLLNIKSIEKREEKIANPLIIGILFGYLAVVHLTHYAIVATMSVVFAFIFMFQARRPYGLINLLLALGFSFILMSPFIYRFAEWYAYPGHNIGLPPDISISSYPSSNVLSWVLFQEGISPNPPLIFAIIGLIIVSSVTIVKKRRQLARLLTTVEIASCLLVASLSLFILFHLQYVFPTLTLLTGEVRRPAISFLVSLYLLIGIFNLLLYDTLRENFHKKLTSLLLQSKGALANKGAIALTFIIMLSIYSPFVYYATAQDARFLIASYAMFSTTTRADYDLMLWMRDNLHAGATSLINPYEPGLYIPSVSHLKAIYPWILSKESQFYLKLIGKIGQGVLNIEAYESMKTLGITHVYLGSKATYEWEKDYKWDPCVFLSNPNFNLTQRIGDAYLFEVFYGNPHVVLEDSFEYEDLSEMGWELQLNVKPPLNQGNGTIRATANHTYHGHQSLITTAKKETGVFYSNLISRKVYVWDPSNVTLSFYINMSIGFSPPDELNMYVFNTSWNQSIKLQSSTGFQSFNISEMWLQTYNATLPSNFYIVIQNIDFDGVENLGYVDFVKVEVGD